MFNPTQIVIEAFINELTTMYERNYTTLEKLHPHSYSSAPGHWAELEYDKGCGLFRCHIVPS